MIIPPLRTFAVTAFALCTFTAASAHAGIYTGAFPREQTPKTYARPDVACDRATDVIRPLETFSFDVAQAGTYTFTITRTDGNTGFAASLYQPLFQPALPCANQRQGEVVTGTSTTLTLVAAQASTFELVISGAQANDIGTFRIETNGPVEPTVRCPYSRLTATGEAFAATGGSHGAEFTPSGAGCADWTTQNVPSWISGIPAAASGPATFTFTAAANQTGAARDACVDIGGRYLCVHQSQGAGCAPGMINSAGTFNAESAAYSFDFTLVDPACTWAAATANGWVRITTPRGVGSGTVQFELSPNDGPQRTAQIMLNNVPFAVTQSSGCLGSLSAVMGSAQPEGGSGSLSVRGGAGCEWTATSNAEWLFGVTIQSGEVRYTVLPWDGAPRTGTLTIATSTGDWSTTYAVEQRADCALMLDSSVQVLDPAGASSSFKVRTGAGCGFVATTQHAWLTYVSADSDTVQFAVAPNQGAVRTGYIEVVSTQTSQRVTFEVRQEGEITAPTIMRHPAPLLLVVEGDPATLAVEVAGAQLTYQWRLHGEDLPGATNATLFIPAAREADEGTYDVLVRNEAGTLLTQGPTLRVTAPADPVRGCSATGASTAPLLMALCAAAVLLRKRAVAA